MPSIKLIIGLVMGVILSQLAVFALWTGLIVLLNNIWLGTILTVLVLVVILIAWRKKVDKILRGAFERQRRPRRGLYGGY